MRILLLLAAVLITPVQATDDLELFETIQMNEQDLTRLGLIPQILQKIDVLQKGLDQNDVVDGKITLSQVGTYSPLTNLFTDIVITGTNITLNLDGRSIVGTIDISGSVVVIKHGAVIAPPPFTLDQATTPAVRIQSGARSVLLKHFHVDCFDSVLTSTLFDSLPGRTAIDVQGSIVSLFDCSISSGASANTTQTDADDAGNTIVLSGSSNRVRIFDCIMITGKGGDAENGSGGSGGIGIHVKDTVSHAEISKCTIFGTGKGGTGSTTGGAGGTGIVIESTADDIEVQGCKIRNTGEGGSPDGLGGKAIRDAVITAGSYSMIFSNFAHNISNEIKFDLRGTSTEQGVSTPYPPDSTVINPYANVYVS